MEVREPFSANMSLGDLYNALHKWHVAKYGNRPVLVPPTFEKLRQEVAELQAALETYYATDGSPIARNHVAEECVDVMIVAAHIIRGVGQYMPHHIARKVNIIYERLTNPAAGRQPEAPAATHEQLYKCNVCGDVFQVKTIGTSPPHSHGCPLNCCGVGFRTAPTPGTPVAGTIEHRQSDIPIGCYYKVRRGQLTAVAQGAVEANKAVTIVEQAKWKVQPAYRCTTCGFSFNRVWTDNVPTSWPCMHPKCFGHATLSGWDEA
jgi:transposase-like protein